MYICHAFLRVRLHELWAAQRRPQDNETMATSGKPSTWFPLGNLPLHHISSPPSPPLSLHNPKFLTFPKPLKSIDLKSQSWHFPTFTVILNNDFSVRKDFMETHKRSYFQIQSNFNFDMAKNTFKPGSSLQQFFKASTYFIAYADYLNSSFLLIIT